MYAARHWAAVRGLGGIGGGQRLARAACIRSSSSFSGDGMPPVAPPVNQAPGPAVPGYSQASTPQAPGYNRPAGPASYNQAPGSPTGQYNQYPNQQVPPPGNPQYNQPQFNQTPPPPGHQQFNQAPAAPGNQQFNQAPGTGNPPYNQPPGPGNQQFNQGYNQSPGFNQPPGPGNPQYNQAQAPYNPGQGAPPQGGGPMYNRPPPPGTPAYRPPPPSNRPPPRSGRSRPGQEVKSLLKPGEDPVEACLKSFGGEVEMRNTFETWAKENNKKYKSPEDKEYRYTCWKETAVKIHQYNPERHGTLTRMNNYADYTVDELYAVITNRDDKPTH